MIDPILIVGAGTTDFTAALELSRFGIRCGSSTKRFLFSQPVSAAHRSSEQQPQSL
jgi:hypothetical protein